MHFNAAARFIRAGGFFRCAATVATMGIASRNIESESDRKITHVADTGYRDSVAIKWQYFDGVRTGAGWNPVPLTAARARGDVAFPREDSDPDVGKMQSCLRSRMHHVWDTRYVAIDRRILRGTKSKFGIEIENNYYNIIVLIVIL